MRDDKRLFQRPLGGDVRAPGNDSDLVPNKRKTPDRIRSFPGSHCSWGKGRWVAGAIIIIRRDRVSSWPNMFLRRQLQSVRCDDVRVLALDGL